MKRTKLLKWLGAFFAAMLLFTVLSRAADSVNVAQVYTKTIQNQVITHEVRGTGKVEGIREQAVFTVEGQRVGRVLVQEGQSVQKGDVLLKLSTDILEESLTEKTEELEVLQLKTRDLESGEAVDGQKQSNSLARAQQNYDLAVSNGDINIANAQLAVDIASQKLQDYYNSRTFSDGSEDSSQEQELLDAVRSSREALNQVIMSRNAEVLEAQRAIEDASLPQALDGSLESARKDEEKVRKEVEKLQKLLDRKGAVKAPTDGVVKSISAQTGSLTSEEAAVILYETGGNLRLTGTITEDDLKYVEIGGMAVIKDSNGKEIEGATIEAVKEDTADPDARILSIQIPEGTLGIGQTAEFSISRDFGPYNACIPLSALYEAEGRKFVYVADTQDSVLGQVMVARRVDVTVVEKNESLAAIQEGLLASDQLVIIDADREIADGSRVRLRDS